MFLARASLALVCLAAGTLPAFGGPIKSCSLVAGRVTIIGDSVTIDAKHDLAADIRGAVIYAKLNEQWYQGVTYAQQARADGRLGTVVVIALGTNGPITSTTMAQMMRVLSPCSRVVLVTNFMPLWWQNPNNRLIRRAAVTHGNVVVADWQALAARHPGWFYPDGIHMPPGGKGAFAFARLVAAKVAAALP